MNSDTVVRVADGVRVLSLIVGTVMVGLIIHLSKDTRIEERFARSRTYARYMIYLFAVTALGGETQMMGDPPTYKTVTNLLAVVFGCMFVLGSYQLKRQSS